jgi:FO synthase subunit 1
MTLEQAEQKLRSLPSTAVIEILILGGEVHPKSTRRSAWLQRIYDIAALALAMGFLPHTNVGPLQFEEMQQLKTVNVSMGLMLEQITPKLLKTVHRQAPSKLPSLRLQQLAWAGELGIPFTTGLLLGIGETEQDWRDTLQAIAHIHQRWGHIQEVILQPHSPGHDQAWQGPALPLEKLVEVVAIARDLLPDDITLQVPPNLVTDPPLLLACIAAGARDLGGIGPIDEVNPDYPHTAHEQLVSHLHAIGWELVPRLPVYPQFDCWLLPNLKQAVERQRQQL